MALSISQVAHRTGLRPSAIRYYEALGLLPKPPRTSGQRQYSTTILNRLAVLQRAKAAGFTLDEIRRLCGNSPESVPIAQRWRHLAEDKLAALDAQMSLIQGRKDLLNRLLSCCACDTVDQCGAGIRAAISSSR